MSRRPKIKSREVKNSTTVGRTSVADLILARTKLLNPPNIHLVSPSGIKKPEPKIITSEKHKEMIFAEAIENRDHYLFKQLEDDEKLPWFHYVKKGSQYSEFVMLTTEMAKSLLENTWKESDGNRKIKPWLKDSYRRDIENDRWIPSDEAIGIDYNGVVYNGRHRLTGLVESGKQWPFYVTFNCLEEAKFTVDSGAKRSSIEKLKLVIDTKLGNRTAGFCRAIMNGLQNKVRYTETEIAEFAHKWQPVIEWVSEKLPIARAEVQAAVAKAYLWYGPEKIEPFVSRLRDVQFSEDGDPAKALYLVLNKAKISRVNIHLIAYKKTLSSIESVINEKPQYRVYEKEDDIFHWEEGWEIPKGSWWNKKN
jgi:hypothetical protein